MEMGYMENLESLGEFKSPLNTRAIRGRRMLFSDAYTDTLNVGIVDHPDKGLSVLVYSRLGAGYANKEPLYSMEDAEVLLKNVLDHIDSDLYYVRVIGAGEIEFEFKEEDEDD